MKQAKSIQEVIAMFKDPRVAFDEAVYSGRLSIDKNATNYAGNFMYMGPGKNGDTFKNKLTREYLA